MRRIRNLIEIVKVAAQCIKTINNWYDVGVVRFGLKDKSILSYRNGLGKLIRKDNLSFHIDLMRTILNEPKVKFLNNEKMTFRLDDHVFETELNEHCFIFISLIKKLISSGCRFPSKGTIILPNQLTFRYPSDDVSALCHIFETFFEETYKLLEVKNRTVVDVGSSFGDTPIYFALKGAKKVYAYEPLREVFQYLLDNIKLSKLEKKILTWNAAVSSKRGKLFIEPEIGWYGRSKTHVSYVKNEKGYCVDAVPLLLDADILKMDCEGCEYDVFLKIDPSSLKFKEIMLEFHQGSRPLISVLSQGGYETKIISEYDNNTAGMLFAKKG